MHNIRRSVVAGMDSYGARARRKKMACRLSACLLVGTLIGPYAFSQQLSAGTTGQEDEVRLRFGGGNSDNIRLQSVSPESTSFKAVGLATNVSHESSRLIGQLVSDLQYRDYTKTDIDDELYGSLSASLEVQALPDRISWFFGDEYAQGRTDPFQLNSPANRDQVNVFSTGPRIRIPVNDRTSIELRGTGSERAFQDTNQFDSSTISSEAALIRSFSSTTDLSINFALREIDYDVIALDYELRTASIAYGSQLASGSASFLVGTSKLEFGTLSDSVLLFDVGWSRDLGARSNLAFSLNQSHVDGLQDLRFSNENDLLFRADVYRRRAAQVQYSTDWNKTSATVRAVITESRYLNDSTVDNDEDTLAVSLTRTMTTEWTLGSSLNRSDRDFVQLSRNDETLTWRVFLQRAFAGRMAMELSYETSSRKGLQATTIDENVVMLFFDVAVLR